MQLNNALRKVLITLKDYVDKITPKKLSDLDIDIDLNSVKTINGQEPDENGNIEIKTIVSWDELQNKPFDEVDSEISEESENPVQNKVVKKYVDDIIPTDEEVLHMLAEADFVDVITDNNGDIFTDLHGEIIVF